MKLNQEKTICSQIDVGADFLGYHFNKSGKSIPAKAETNLENRLESVWLASAGKSIEEKLEKIIAVIGGWKQYFIEEREIKSIFEFAALIYASESKTEYFGILKEKRKKVLNIYKDISAYLSEIWKEHGDRLSINICRGG